MYNILLTSNFKEDILDLDTEARSRILQKVKSHLAEHPEKLKQRLSRTPDGINRPLYKYRIGDYRVIYFLNQTEEELVLYKVGHRSEIYNEIFS